MKAQHLGYDDPVPGGWVAGREHHLGKVVVWLGDGRVWVYDWDDEADAVEWWIGSSQLDMHVCRWGPFESQRQAFRAKDRHNLRGQVFALPEAHSREH